MSASEEPMRLFSSREVAKMLRVSDVWLWRNRKTADRIPFIKINRKIYYEEREIIAWLKKHKTKGNKNVM